MINMQRRHLVTALPLVAVGAWWCMPATAVPQTIQVAHPLMGTQVNIAVAPSPGLDATSTQTAIAAAYAEMTRLANMMSHYRADSVVNAINMAAGIQAVVVPPELMQILHMAQLAAQRSAGQFDITVGSIRGWRFDPQHPSIASAQQVKDGQALVNYKNMVLNDQKNTAYLTQQKMRIDLGGIAKLPILAAGLQVLKQHHVRNAMVNGGGDVLVAGHIQGRPWRIGVRNPQAPSRQLGYVELEQGFVASSGDYERSFMHQGQRLHHILDPKTGTPTQGTQGVTLVSEDIKIINGLGTATMVAGLHTSQENLAKNTQLDALIADAKEGIWMSHGMQRRLLRT